MSHKFVIGALAIATMCTLMSVGTAADNANPKKKKKQAAAPTMADQMLKQFSAADLTEEQKAKITEICEKNAPKIAELAKTAPLTDEQKTARATVMKEVRESGKKGKEAREAIESALSLSEEQKEAMMKANEARKECREECLAVLTPEQRKLVVGPKKPKN